jgi:hypothetical protein
VSGSPAGGATATDPTVHFTFGLANADDMAKNVAAGADDDDYLCQIDGASIPGQPGTHPDKGDPDWSVCRDDHTVTLADGQHTLNIRSVFQVGGHVNGWSFWGPVATRTFTIDTSSVRACSAAAVALESADAKVARVRERLRRARQRGHRKAAHRYRSALKKARASARAAKAAQRDAC